MNNIAKFYTWFWIIYFPVCIAFTNIVNFDYSDEILTILMVIYAYTQNKKLNISYRRKQEIKFCAGVFVFYLIYSWILKINTDRAIFLDITQQARPYLIFYLTWILAPEFTERQKKTIKIFMLLTFVVFTGLTMFAQSIVNKYVNTSQGISESAIMGQIALSCAMIFYLFSPQTKRNKLITIIILLVGLLGGKSKYYGEVIAFITLIFYVKKKIQFNSPKIIFQLSALAAVIIFFTWTKFNAYYVEGMLDETERKARPETYKTSLKIMTDYIPFGSGFGTFGCAAAAKEYSPLYYTYNLSTIWGLQPENPMFLADAFYPIYIAQFGIFGVILFFIFWKRRVKETKKINNIIYYRMALMCILALAIEQAADSSYLSGKGMGYFMILALCLNSNRFFSNRNNQKENVNQGQINNNVQRTYRNKGYRRH